MKAVEVVTACVSACGSAFDEAMLRYRIARRRLTKEILRSL